MKKLHIINLGKMGGVERLFLQYINDTLDGSNDVICVSSEVGEEISKQISHQKITFANRLFSALPLRCPQFLRKYWLKRKIEKANADVIIVWDLIPGLSAKPKRGKLIYYDHGCSWRYAKNHKTLGFFAMLDGCISASYASKRVMELRFNLPITPQVVINRIQTPADINPQPKSLGQPIRIGSASRLVTLKGISVTLLMMKELLQRGHNVTLEIAGKGPDREKFQQLVDKLQINDHVIFSGFQDNVANFFNRIDVYMSTPITEPFGLSCMESLYYGVPVIFPQVDGQPEAIKDGHCGIGLIPNVTIEQHEHLSGIKVDFPYDVYNPITDSLVRPQLLSHTDCADAFEKLIVPDVYQTMSQNARNYPVENFNYALFKKEFDSVLNSYTTTP